MAGANPAKPVRSARAATVQPMKARVIKVKGDKERENRAAVNGIVNLWGKKPLSDYDTFARFFVCPVCRGWEKAKLARAWLEVIRRRGLKIDFDVTIFLARRHSRQVRQLFVRLPLRSLNVLASGGKTRSMTGTLKLSFTHQPADLAATMSTFGGHGNQCIGILACHKENIPVCQSDALRLIFNKLVGFTDQRP